MAENDYRRGLRGGSCLNYDGQAYTDWYAGNVQYEINNGIYEAPTDADRERWWKEEKENAFEKAEDMEWGTIFAICVFAFIVFIVGLIVIIFLEPLFGIKLSSLWAGVIPGIMVFGTIWGFVSSNNEALKAAEKKYGKR